VLSKGRVIVAAASLAAIAATFVLVLPRIADYGAVWRVLHTLSWPWLCGLTGVTVLNLATFPLPWVAALTGLGYVNALRMTMASTAFSLVVPGGAPVGMAASFAMLRAWGLDGAAVTRAVALTGVFNQLSTFVFPVVAVLLLAVEGTVSMGLELVALLGLGVGVAVAAALASGLARDRFARAIGDRAAVLASRLSRLRRRGAVTWDGTAFVRFRSESLTLLRERWLALSVTTLVNQLVGFLLLELSLRAFGITRAQVPVAASFAAWSIGRVLASLPLTPGGIGAVEIGLTTSLIGFGGPNAKVVAAVLVYRAASIAPTVVAGLLAAATWRLQQPLGSPVRHEDPNTLR
jgi:uncharacterized membrane protein YbhN (UPF0104 family)